LSPGPDPATLAVAVRAHPEGATVALRVVPRAPRTMITGRHGDAVKLKVKAPPVEGAANAAIAAFLAGRVGVRPGDVEVIAGARGRDKVVLIRGVTVEDVQLGLARDRT
jgi:uncharacterized protein